MAGISPKAGPLLFVVVAVTMVALRGVQSAFRSSSPLSLPTASSADAIVMGIHTNATNLLPGQRLDVNVSLFNALLEPNDVRTARNWTFNGFPISMWPGCSFVLPATFTILNGNFSLPRIEAMGNVTGAGYVCMEGTTVDHVLFQPESSDVNLTGTFCAAGCTPNQVYGPYRLVSNFTVNGYWDYPITGQDSKYLETPYDGGVTYRYPEVGPIAVHPFSPGVYTLVVADEWGQTAVLHFTVTAASGGGESSSVTTAVTSSECTISAEGSGFYVAVLSDAGQPIQGAEVSGTRVTEVNGGTCSQSVGTMLTNSTGSVLITPNIGSYYQLIIQYQGQTFSVRAPIEPMQTTYVTLRIPSGNVSVTEVPYGGCVRTANSTTCPG